MMETAKHIISSCETALNRKLSLGERRDLLKDNTHWTSQECDDIAAKVSQ